jgi:phosphoglycolate phosphatase-like HAD superfamily hydrolase
MKAKAVLFDFDGVIVESVGVKTEAFRELFANEPEHLPAILALHLANGGMSRFTKFEIIHRDILKRPLSAQRSRELGEGFSALVMQKVIACPYMPGALEFIQKHATRLPLFIASSTPQTELHEILLRRNLAGYFCETHGTPRGKPEIMQDLLIRYKLDLKDMPFIGDAINDYKAASEIGLPFYGFVPASGGHPFPPDVKIISDFTQLESVLF